MQELHRVLEPVHGTIIFFVFIVGLILSNATILTGPPAPYRIKVQEKSLSPILLPFTGRARPPVKLWKRPVNAVQRYWE
jgi:hypothetical protein